VERGEIRALPYQFSFGDKMTTDKLIAELTKDCEYYTRKYETAVMCHDMRAADWYVYLKQTRSKLEVTMQIKAENNMKRKTLEDHELIQWANAGYPPVIDHVEPLSHSVEDDWSDGYAQPTVDEWYHAAQRYVETGKQEHYDLMLARVCLDHRVHSLWDEAEPVKTAGEPKDYVTLADLWYALRVPVLIIAVLMILFIVVLGWIS
jgi:hypothetical protein